jgi:hypothetical protein
MNRTDGRRRLVRLLLAFIFCLAGLLGTGPPPAAASSTIHVGRAVAIAPDGTCSLLEAFDLLVQLRRELLHRNDCGGTVDLRWPVAISLSSRFTYEIRSTHRWPFYRSSRFAFPQLSESDRQLIIEGNGATIQRPDTSEEEFGFFDVNGGSLVLRNVTIKGSSGPQGAINVGNNGTLRMTTTTLTENRGGALGAWKGTILIEDSILSDNYTPTRGGAIRLSDGSRLEITRSVLRQNIAEQGGGAIWGSKDSSIVIRDSTLLRNYAPGQPPFLGAGGAIGAESSTSVSISESTLRENEAESGGAIYVFNNPIERGEDERGVPQRYTRDTHLTISRSSLTGNSARRSDGGAVWTWQTQVEIVQSTLSGNRANRSGGALFGLDNIIFTIRESTLARNEAYDGGALAVIQANRNAVRGRVTVLNSTFSGNLSYREGSAVDAKGWLDVTLAFVTLADNGGFFAVTLSDHYAKARVHNSVMADAYSECRSRDRDRFTFSGRVLVDDESCGSRGALQVVPGLRRTLGDLADNGGPTWTHALRSDSPALGAVPAGQCTDTAGNRVENDQRGQMRPNPLGSNCDAGAYEAEQGAPASGAPGSVAPRPGGPGSGSGQTMVTVDLALTGGSLPAKVMSGQRFDVTLSVLNASSIPVSGASVRLYLSRDRVIDSTDTVLGSCIVDVPASGRVDCTIRGIAVGSSGTYYLIGRVTAPSGTIDSNLANNEFSSILSVL